MAGRFSLLVLGAAVLLVGMVLPARFIGSGVESFEGKERKMAELAYRMLGNDLNEVPGPGLFVTAYRVTSVKECPVTPTIEEEGRLNRRLNPAPVPPAPPPFDAPPSSAEFRTYTIFGIPSGTASVECEDS